MYFNIKYHIWCHVMWCNMCAIRYNILIYFYLRTYTIFFLRCDFPLLSSYDNANQNVTKKSRNDQNVTIELLKIE